MKWVRYGLRETASKGRRECMDSCRIDVSEELGRYRPSCVRARSLRSDRAVCVLGRYVATELGWSSVATLQPSCVCARSLCSDRAWLELGRYVATEPCECSVATYRPSCVINLLRFLFPRLT
ncbi:hypothetical protein F2Q70_00021533 [Brassica cretica]|uniref:Uncharacterized protein n=1 Tax=Brassica cretica TaxID=69181 RepID=A0A8S9GMJ2_BRACR|nr:hypothetical protein F2Q70_00021533 [Brassica cretica]